VKVRLYVEGGGSHDQTQRICRQSFHVFLGKVLGDRSKPKIVASGSRDVAYKDFRRSLNDEDVVSLLLVDSEDPVQVGKTVAAHLLQRDGWKELPDGQVHLMVQCMEAWFLADKEALQDYYGPEFKAGSLPTNPKIEGIAKHDVIDGLRAATRENEYHKTKHAFDILQCIDPAKVKEASPFAKSFFEALVKHCDPTRNAHES